MFAIVFCYVSSTNLNALEKSNIADDRSACSLYAEYMALEFEANGLNYWNGYFGGYSKCVDILYG